MHGFEHFEKCRFKVGGADIAPRLGGDRDKPPLALLYAFPQTHVMWHRLAQRLRHDFFLMLPDLRGYGDLSHASGAPPMGLAVKKGAHLVVHHRDARHST